MWLVLLCGALIGLEYGATLPTSYNKIYNDAASSLLNWEVVELGLIITSVLLLLAFIVLGCAWCDRYKVFNNSDIHETLPPRVHARDSGFHEEVIENPASLYVVPTEIVNNANNNVQEDNNNGPISLREMQNIQNNNATVYIISENEDRNYLSPAIRNRDRDQGIVRLNHSQESVVEFEPLPVNITPSHALPAQQQQSTRDDGASTSSSSGIQNSQLIRECSDWFETLDNLQRSRLQYLREVGRGWFGRIVQGELENGRDSIISVAVKILNQNVSVRDKCQYLSECKLFRDINHDNVLRLIDYSLTEEPWIILFDFYAMDMKQFLLANRVNKSALYEQDVPLRLQTEVASALAYVHSKGFVHGDVSCRCVYIRPGAGGVSAVLGGLGDAAGRYPRDYYHGLPLRWAAPEQLLRAPYTVSVESDVWSLGVFMWETCCWGERPFDALSDEIVAEGLRAHLIDDTDARPLMLSMVDADCPYKEHLYETMCSCWLLRATRAHASWVCARLRGAPSAPPPLEADMPSEVLTALSPLDRLLASHDDWSPTTKLVKSPSIDDFTAVLSRARESLDKQESTTDNELVLENIQLEESASDPTVTIDVENEIETNRIESNHITNCVKYEILNEILPCDENNVDVEKESPKDDVDDIALNNKRKIGNDDIFLVVDDTMKKEEILFVATPTEPPNAVQTESIKESLTMEGNKTYVLPLKTICETKLEQISVNVPPIIVKSESLNVINSELDCRQCDSIVVCDSDKTTLVNKNSDLIGLNNKKDLQEYKHEAEMIVNAIIRLAEDIVGSSFDLTSYIGVTANDGTIGSVDFNNESYLNNSTMESTKYLNISTLNDDNKLTFETKNLKEKQAKINMLTSTPKVSTFSKIKIENKPNYGDGVIVNKLEQDVATFIVAANDENCSSAIVTIGPFESETLDLFKAVKSNLNFDDSNVSEEEILAFSSNFTELNKQTISEIQEASTNKSNELISHNDVTVIIEQGDSDNVKESESPNTPPNTPGYIFLNNTIPLNSPMSEPEEQENSEYPETNFNPCLISQYDDAMKMQYTAKLAMAENENNLNIEHSGPFDIEAIEDDTIDENHTDEQADGPSCSNAEGGQPGERWSRCSSGIDDDSMAALRSELTLKLPLAQSVPLPDTLPPPPPDEEDEDDEMTLAERVAAAEQLILYSYPTPLSPIREESGSELSAYHRDIDCSSETYPEPCTDQTFPVQATLTQVLSMSTDSLEEITDGTLRGCITPTEHNAKKYNEQTYTKEDDCEKLSQISSNILTNDTRTRCWKPTEKVYMSRTTSLDSWCSNDTLFNVEDHFDDGVENVDSMEERAKSDKSVSESTYVVCDNLDEIAKCDSFTPDSLTSNFTYVQVKNEESDDSSKSDTLQGNTYTVDCQGANYETCAKVVHQENPWQRQSSIEMVRRSVVEEANNSLPSDPLQNASEEVNFKKPLPTVGMSKMDSIDMPNVDFGVFNEQVTSTPLVVGLVEDINMSGNDNDSENILKKLQMCGDDMQSLDSFSTFSSNIKSKHQTNEQMITIPTIQIEKHNFDSSNFAEFEESLNCRPQDLKFFDESKNSLMNVTEDFLNFERMAHERPQDLGLEVSNLSAINAEDTTKSSEKNTSDKSQYNNLDFLDRNIHSSEIIEFTDSSNKNTEDSSNTHSSQNIDSNENERQQSNEEINEAQLLNLAEEQVEIFNIDNVTSSDYNSSHTRSLSSLQRVENEDSVMKTSLFENFHCSAIQRPQDLSGLVFNTHSDPNDDSPVCQEQPNSILILPDMVDEMNHKVLDAYESLDDSTKLIIDESIIDGESDSEDEQTPEQVEAAPAEIQEGLIKEEVTDERIVADKDSAINSETHSLEYLDDIGSSKKNMEIHTATRCFLENERLNAASQLVSMLTDIRLTGLSPDCMSTSFIQESPTEPEAGLSITSCRAQQTSKDWDSSSDEGDSSSSSGEFVWKEGDGDKCISLTPTKDFNHHQQNKNINNATPMKQEEQKWTMDETEDDKRSWGPSSECDGSSEGSEVEFVPSCWDMAAEPSKSSIRRGKNDKDGKKRVVFKRQKYHCVYEYPRETPDSDCEMIPSPYLSEFTSHTGWDLNSCTEDYSQLMSAGGNPFDFFRYHSNYPPGLAANEFFMSSMARPLGSSEFCPAEHFPDHTTPDSGVGDLTPANINDKWGCLDTKTAPDLEMSGNINQTPPVSPGVTTLGGLRHTRDRLTLQLPPSPLPNVPGKTFIFSPINNKQQQSFTTFGKEQNSSDEENKPKSENVLNGNHHNNDETINGKNVEIKCKDLANGNELNTNQNGNSLECNMIKNELMDNKLVKLGKVNSQLEIVKGEGTLLDSGDEDSGIESSAKTTLERIEK